MNRIPSLVTKRGLQCCALCVIMVSIGCRDTAPPPHMPRDLGTKEQPLLPLNSPWTDRAIREGQAEWVPFRAPGEPRKPGTTKAEKTDVPEAGADDAAEGGHAEVTALVDEYDKTAAEFNVDEMVKYFVESQEPQLRAAYEHLGLARESAAKLKERLLQQEGADADAINSAFDKVAQFTSGRLQIKEAHAHEDQKVHVIFEPGSFLAGGTAQLDGKDWYLEAAALSDVEGIKNALSPVVEQMQKLSEGEPAAADILAALSAIELPVLGSAAEPEAPPENAAPEADAEPAAPEKEPE